MAKCDFCKEILTEEEFYSEFHDIEDNYFGIYHYLVYSKEHKQILLKSASITDNYFYNQTDEMNINYCPMCGRELKANEFDKNGD